MKRFIELETISFRLDMVPPKATAQQKGLRVINGNPHFYEKAHVREAKEKIILALKEHAPKKPFEGPLLLKVKWIYPLRSSETKARKSWASNVGPLPCHTRPDGDNILKSFCDALTSAGFCRDDAQFAVETIEKYWGERPGIEVKIARLQNP